MHSSESIRVADAREAAATRLRGMHAFFRSIRVAPYARGIPCRESRAYARAQRLCCIRVAESRSRDAREAASTRLRGMHAFFGKHPRRRRTLRERALPHGLCALRLGANRPCWSKKEETKSGQKGTEKRPKIEYAAKTRKRVNFRPESKKFIIIV